MKLLCGFNQLPSAPANVVPLCPKTRGLLDQPSLGAVTRQQFRLVLSDLGEVAFEGLGNAGVQRASRLAQKRAVGRILHQSMFEKIACVRRHALPKQQTCRNETVERGLEFRFRLARNRGQSA